MTLDIWTAQLDDGTVISAADMEKLKELIATAIASDRKNNHDDL